MGGARDWFYHPRKNGCLALAGGGDSSTVSRACQKPENRNAASFPDRERCRRCGGCEETASPLIAAHQNLWWKDSPGGIPGREYGFHRDGYRPVPGGSFLVD